MMEVRSIRRAIGEMSTEFLHCRELGHSWRHERTEVVERRRISRRFDCLRCGTVRFDLCRRDGQLEKRKYAYATDYHVKGLGRGPIRYIFRAESIRRELP